MFFRAFFFFKDFHHEQKKKKKKNFLSFRENEREREKRRHHIRLSCLLPVVVVSSDDKLIGERRRTRRRKTHSHILCAISIRYIYSFFLVYIKQIQRSKGGRSSFVFFFAKEDFCLGKTTMTTTKEKTLTLDFLMPLGHCNHCD